MAHIKIQGIVTLINPEEVFPSGFSKRVFVVDNGSKYDSTIPCTLVKDDVSLASTLKLGDRVVVSGFLGGREYNGKYYLDFRATGIENQSVQGPTAPQGNHQSPAITAPTTASLLSESGDDDLPF
jgi:hypothetical protein